MKVFGLSQSAGSLATLVTLEDCLIKLICLSLWWCNDCVCIICFVLWVALFAFFFLSVGHI